MDSIRIVILAGGQSSRMGSPKHLLPVPSTGQPLYQQLIHVVHDAFPGIQTVHFSVASSSIFDDVLQREEVFLTPKTGVKSIKLVKIPDKTTHDIGPAAGLLAAHHYDPTATWLVVACDFPLLDPAALHQLRQAFEDPVTCFINKDGFSEPLLAMWNPQALQSLSENVKSGLSGPNYTVKRLKGKLITPIKNDWILNTNTMEEWEAVKSRIGEPQ